MLDSAGPRFEGVSRWRGMGNYERFIADPSVVAAIGPQTSSEGRGIAVELSRADLATITPSSTSFDITAPEFKDHLRPGGRAVYFRTVGTDLAQGEAMARFARGRLGVRRLVTIDDGTDFAVRQVSTFAHQADRLGMTVVARRQVHWTHGDYRPHLREVRELHPEAVYFAGGYAVGLKLARQIAEVLPSVHRLGAESLHNRAFPIQVGPTTAEGWYVSNVAPDLEASPAAAAWADRFRRRFGEAPSHNALAAHTAVTVVADAIGRVVKRGRPVTRSAVRDAIQATRLPDTLQGAVSFDPSGDLERPVVSIYQLRDGAFQYVGAVTGSGAPRTAAAGGSRP